jgi:hypothetical protein
MKIKELAKSLYDLENKYTAKLGDDFYLCIDRHNETNDNYGYERCCQLTDIKDNKNNRMQISDLLSKYYPNYYSSSGIIFKQWIIDSENSSNLKEKRISFIWRGKTLKEKLVEEFTGNIWVNYDERSKYDSLSKSEKKKLLLGILHKLASMKYNSHATINGKKKLEKFFEKMSKPFASVCGRWYDDTNQQEMFNPTTHYPIEQEDWFKGGYKNKKEYEQSMEEDDYDDYCSCCGHDK